MLRVVEAEPEHAVAWTKPEDLLIDDDDPLRSMDRRLSIGAT